MTETVPAATMPWWSSTRHGFMVGGLEVAWWGCYCIEAPRLPERWQAGPDGPGEITPTDFELDCFVHLAKHEAARVAGEEMLLLVECLGLFEPVPAHAVQAAADGHTLVGFCPGVGWHWPTENLPTAFAKKHLSADR